MRRIGLLLTLVLWSGLQAIVCSQQTMANSLSGESGQCSIPNSQLYKVPARKEILHKLKPSQREPLEAAATRASGEYIMQEFPTMGEIRGVVLLVAFQDKAFSLPDDSVRTLLQNRYDGENYTEYIEHQGYSEVDGDVIGVRAEIPGSARDYFCKMSMGQFTPRFDVIGPITVSNPYSYYGGNNKSGNDKNAHAMITEACLKAYAQGHTDFADYDNDGDGIVDCVYVVYAGSDEAQTGIEDCVWAHASTVSLALGNGMRISRYACSGELFVDLEGMTAGIGTFVHEFSHILGLPDFYNTKAEDFTMDVWSVMDYGMYNRGGFVPCAYTAFERYSLGWLPLQTLSAPATMNIGTTDEEGTGYRIFTAEIDSTTFVTEADTASFYLVETIRREGWNRYAYGEGLLISEVTYRASAWQNNTVNVGTRHRHCIVPADSVYSYASPQTQLYGIANHSFSLTSVPASITQFGASMDKPLTDIRYDASTGRTTFHFRGGSLIERVGLSSNAMHSAQSFDLWGRSVQIPSKGIYIEGDKKYLAR